ncbi:PREDICTED: lymphocyte antigen 6 complex locus protein G5c [Elephantulus edwardii]|uniref:lymphocyte antigen 6 complex locus protein G5c n=1 Tax=Elephantulus edwardii TaxID=28737 RepID=UPI0003F09C5E|nr:PREDICTED: lymphocyte antigen 6 complex locus protein G5c [Elephantulus edwardii]
MYFMECPTGSRSLGPPGSRSKPCVLCVVLLLMLAMKSSVLVSVLPCILGKFAVLSQELPAPPEFSKYLRCYRCLFETKKLGCLLGSDICLVPKGSSCITIHIRNSSTEFMVSDCCRNEQMRECSHTRISPVFGFWIYSRCCFMDFCNDPQNRELHNS